jgi:L-serine deaminase
MERSVTKLLSRAESMGGIAAAMREWQLRHDDTVRTNEDMDARMRQALAVMRESVIQGLDPKTRSVSGLTGGNAKL